MSEWKELKIDKLPEDILTVDYEFEFFNTTYQKEWLKENDSVLDVLIRVITGTAKHLNFRYRKPEPKAPTHTQIMTLWFKTDREQWLNVISYFTKGDFQQAGIYLTSTSSWKDKDWFTGRESAICPPEAV